MNKEGIINITTKFETTFAEERCFAELNTEQQQGIVRKNLVSSLAEYLDEHFDELPISIMHKTNEDLITKTYELHLNLASNLVPIVLNFKGKPIKTYIPRDTAEKLGLSRDIEHIVLKDNKDE